MRDNCLLWVADPRNDEKKEETVPNSHEGVTDVSDLLNTVERDKLLFSVFSLLHKLGADERPEVFLEFFFFFLIFKVAKS